MLRKRKGVWTMASNRYRSKAGDGAQDAAHAGLSAFAQQGLLGLPAQHTEPVQVPIEKFGPLVDARFLELVYPASPAAGGVDLRPPARDAAAAVESFDAVPHPRAVLHQDEVAAAEFLQRVQTVLTVIDRPQGVQAQQIGELVRVDGVVFASRLQQGVVAWITDHQAADGGASRSYNQAA